MPAIDMPILHLQIRGSVDLAFPQIQISTQVTTSIASTPPEFLRPLCPIRSLLAALQPVW